MPEEFFDVAYINFDKAILHGRVRLGLDENRCVREAYVEQVLTADQKRQIEDLNSDHRLALDKLLASFVDRDALERTPDEG